MRFQIRAGTYSPSQVISSEHEISILTNSPISPMIPRKSVYEENRHSIQFSSFPASAYRMLVSEGARARRNGTDLPLQCSVGSRSGESGTSSPRHPAAPLAWRILLFGRDTRLPRKIHLFSQPGRTNLFGISIERAPRRPREALYTARPRTFHCV